MPQRQTPRAATIPLLLLLVLAGCGDAPTAAEPLPEPRLVVQARLTGTPATALAIEVTAPDIVTPLIFNLAVDDGVARGTVAVPAGSDRLLVARAFDARNVETHRGSRTLQVRPGANDAVGVTLHPLHGEQAIEATIGDYAVAVEPAAATVPTGQTLELSATVRDADGAVVAGAVVQWASLDPVHATVGPHGTVTARDPGSARIVAVFRGSGAAALVTIPDPH